MKVTDVMKTDVAVIKSRYVIRLYLLEIGYETFTVQIIYMERNQVLIVLMNYALIV